MRQFLYWPYDEVTVTESPDGTKAVVTTPWLEAAVAITDANRADLKALAQKFKDASLTPADGALVNWFFGKLTQYPFCYTLPVGKPGKSAAGQGDGGGLDEHKIADKSLLAASVAELLASSLLTADEFTDIGKSDVATVTTMLARTHWDWDVESALAFARTGDKVHPESLHSVARRFHLLDLVTGNRGRANFSFIETLTGDEFKRAAGIMVRQNHYVTQKCHTSLLPALDRAGKARGEVESFIKEENGHDRLLGVAVKAFADDPESVPVSRQTKALMHLLRFAAKRNFLAFAMAIDFFERSSYEKADPLAQLLVKGGFDKAARQINRHMDINDAGGHENVAVGFLAPMAPVDAEYAVEALRIAELVTLVMNSVPQSAVALYQGGGAAAR